MRVIIIGGNGHIGTYLVPMLVEKGHNVVNVSRGVQAPYLSHSAWSSVQQITADRAVEDRDDTFAKRIRDLHPDVVIDLICFTESSVHQLITGLHGQVQHFLHCGTIWIYGYSTQVPGSEDQPRRPFDTYGIQKAAIEAALLDAARRNGFPATCLHPGHIVGPGYAPLNPAGHFNPEVFARLARGEELALPNLGMELAHPVHAADVAQAFMKALFYRSASLGESFNIVSASALTLRGYAEAVAAWFGKEANLKFLPWPEWKSTASPEDAAATWEHIVRSPNASIAKAQRMINYQPKYTSLEAVFESVRWLIAHGQISTV